MSYSIDTLVLRAIEYWEIDIHVVVLVLVLGFVDAEKIAVFIVFITQNNICSSS